MSKTSIFCMFDVCFLKLPIQLSHGNRKRMILKSLSCHEINRLDKYNFFVDKSHDTLG